ncbi:MAG: IPT/TIG domain-containing protein [Dehalococcoidia bacterium]
MSKDQKWFFWVSAILALALLVLLVMSAYYYLAKEPPQTLLGGLDLGATSVISLVALALLTIAAIIVSDAAPSGFDRRGTVIAALGTTCFAAPVVGLATSVAAYLVWNDRHAPLFGAVTALLVWLLLALLFRRSTGADRANTTSYLELCHRYDVLDARLSSIDLQSPIVSPAAYKQAVAQRTFIGQQLGRSPDGTSGAPDQGLAWVLGSGYIDLWRRMHRAEEVLIEIEAPEQVSRGALDDWLRLKDSTIEHGDELQSALSRALHDFDPAAVAYIDGQLPSRKNGDGGADRDSITGPHPQADAPPDRLRSEAMLVAQGPNQTDTKPPTVSAVNPSSGGLSGGTSVTIAGSGFTSVTSVAFGPQPATQFSIKSGSQITASSPAGTGTVHVAVTTPSGSSAVTDADRFSYDPQPNARAALREVRYAIDDFRDQRWSGILRVRNNLIGAVVIAGLATYALLALAIVSGASQAAIRDAAAFFLVGAAIGLFKLIYDETQSETAVDDYGLSWARLVNTPLFSGLGAVGGVLLFAMGIAVSPKATPATLAPSPAPSASAALSVTPAVVLTTVTINGVSQSTPTPTPGTGSPNQTQVPRLDRVFDLTSNPFYIIIAAIFGLTPKLLIDRLLKQTDQYKTDLQSSQATEKATPSQTGARATS